MDLDEQIKYRCSVKAQSSADCHQAQHCSCVNMVINTNTSSNKSVCTKTAAKQVKFRKDLNNNNNKELLQPALKIEKISNINNKSIIADKRMAGATRERTRDKQSGDEDSIITCDKTRDKTRDKQSGGIMKNEDSITQELQEMTKGGGWREALKFYSNMDLSNVCLSDRDTKIICLMMKRLMNIFNINLLNNIINNIS